MAAEWTQTSYGGWPNCYRLATDFFELVVTAEVGPRIIKFAPRGKPNLFKEFPEQGGLTGGDQWRIYGGHRLWHAPEDPTRTYAPDNYPVEVVEEGKTVRFKSPLEISTSTQKEISIVVSPDETGVTIEHRIYNCGPWPISFSPWCLSAMKEGGVAIIPLPKKAPHSNSTLSSNWSMSCWSFTDISDSRYRWGEKFLRVSQNCAQAAQKIGLFTGESWAAYAVDEALFIKSVDSFSLSTDTVYPDRGAQWEFFTDQNMLEVESLGPLTLVGPEESCLHTERWRLVDGWSTPNSDSELYDKIRKCNVD